MRPPFSASAVLIVVLAQLSVPPAAQGRAPLLRPRARAPKGELLPARVHLYDAAGKPVRPEGLPFWRDHFVCAGQADLPLPPGEYRYEVERGPEYKPARGKVSV